MRNRRPFFHCPRWILNLTLVILMFCHAGLVSFAIAGQPNIVVVLADDLGYGDVSFLNHEGRIATPHLDDLASEAVVFTDAHSGSSVCTPTRYGLLTGRYAWRTKLQKGVVTGFSPSLIDAHRPTLASFLKSKGYVTGCVGKWHLNFQYLDPNDGQPLKRKDVKLPPVGATIPDGPLDRGFDHFVGFHHSRDMKAVIEGRTVKVHDDPMHMLGRIEAEAVEFIQQQQNDSRPFFLYVPLSSPHTPIVPTQQWQGKSGLNAYGDFVQQTDSVVGSIIKAIDRHGLKDNTLVVFTSDNGCSRAAGIAEMREQGHRVSGPYRGSKADLWDGGHRVPFFVRWPRRQAGPARCDDLICLTDVFATVADLLSTDVPSGSGEDSVSFYSALAGTPGGPRRNSVVHHSVSGHFSFRKDNWKLLLAKGSGGWSAPREKELSDDQPPAQLYDLGADIGETTNLYHSRPELAKQMLNELQSIVDQGRSTPGPPARNDIDNIKLWKSK